jgi:hypothetical protein
MMEFIVKERLKWSMEGVGGESEKVDGKGGEGRGEGDGREEEWAGFGDECKFILFLLGLDSSFSYHSLQEKSSQDKNVRSCYYFSRWHANAAFEIFPEAADARKRKPSKMPRG